MNVDAYMTPVGWVERSEMRSIPLSETHHERLLTFYLRYERLLTYAVGFTPAFATLRPSFYPPYADLS